MKWTPKSSLQKNSYSFYYFFLCQRTNKEATKIKPIKSINDFIKPLLISAKLPINNIIIVVTKSINFISIIPIT